MKKETKSLLITLLILAALTIIFWNPIVNIVSEPMKTRVFLAQFGILAPIAFMTISLLQVIFAPVPGQLTGAAGGFAFGIFWGTIYSLVGVTIGSFIVLVLSRKFGRPFVEKQVDKRTLDKFDNLIKKGGIPIIFAIFLLPFFPDDLILYIIGLTQIRIRTIMIVTSIARIPTFIILSAIGDGISYNNPTIYLVIGILLLIAGILYVKREEIEKKLLKKWQ